MLVKITVKHSTIHIKSTCLSFTSIPVPRSENLLAFRDNKMYKVEITVQTQASLGLNVGGKSSREIIFYCFADKMSVIRCSKSEKRRLWLKISEKSYKNTINLTNTWNILILILILIQVAINKNGFCVSNLG